MNNSVDPFLNVEVKQYDLLPLRRKKILQEIRKALKENEKYISEANKIDLNHWKKVIEIEKLQSVVDRYIQSEEECNNDEIEKIVVNYYGNPYLTVSICIQAILNHKVLLLENSDYMLGVNTIVIDIINEVLKENKIQNLIYKVMRISSQDIEKVKEAGIRVVIIGARNNLYKYKKDFKYKFFSYNNYNIYCENEELEELKTQIYKFAYENLYEMEVLYEKTPQNAISAMNKDIDNISVVLTKNAESKEQYKKEIKTERVYINTNPFGKEEFNVYKKYFI